MDRYDSVLSSLFVRFPSVGRAGFTPGAYKPGLERMLEFDALLGSPSRALHFIHVAGTNGKGSVSSMLASSLAAGGRRVGLFTSPHLLDFRERIKIVSDDGAGMIPREAVLAFVDRWDEVFDSLALSFFEITTGMALDWFRSEEVDVAVMEVGLGGRLDSTNIIVPDLSIVTSIGLDHCAQLGDTRALIAAEKAGIFKTGVPALVGERDEETAPVFASRALSLPCPLFFADDLPAVPAELDLGGEYQRRNLRTVLAALRLLGEEPDWDAIRHTAARTGLRGRWETLRREPLTICDIGHNPPALALNFAQLESMMESGCFPTLHIVYGVMADKALDDIIPLMPAGATYWFVTPDTPRALPAREIAESFERVRGCPAKAFDSVAEALDAMEQFLRPNDLVYIGGSTYVVSDAIKYYQQ